MNEMKPNIIVETEFRPFLLDLKKASEAIGLFEMKEKVEEIDTINVQK
jgi:hypothetical protein